MKYIPLLLFFFMLSSFKAKSQYLDSAVARNVARKMRDSFALSPANTDSIYSILKRARLAKKCALERYQFSPMLKPALKRIDSLQDVSIKNVFDEKAYAVYLKNKRVYLTTN